MATVKPWKKRQGAIEEVKFPMSVIEGLEDALKQSGGDDALPCVTVEPAPISTISWLFNDIPDPSKLTVVSLRGYISKDLLMRFDHYGGSMYKVYCTDLSTSTLIYNSESDNVIDANNTTIDEFLTAGTSKQMPQIRFVGMPCDGKWGFYEDPELMDGEISYPIVKFTVEITSGAVQVGDTIQLCRMAKYGALFHEDGSIRRGARRKLRRMAEYAITYDDIGKRFITFDVDPMLWEKAMRLFTRTNHSSQGGISMSPMYFRIRRPKGELQTNESGMSVDAEFSNVVTVWKTCQAWQNSEGDDCGILRII